MIWKDKSYYFEKDDQTKIHYKMNFNPSDIKDKDLVIVFNYGLVCNFDHFVYQLEYFHNQGYNVLIHDYRCHFGSTSKDGIKSCNFKNICHDLKCLLDELKIQNTYMIAHSMGVNVTLEFARLYPEYLKSMALISGTVFPPQDVMFDSNIVDITEPFIKKAKDKLGNFINPIWKNIHKNPVAQVAVWQGGFNMKQTEIAYVENYMKKIGELDPDLFFHLLDEMKAHDIINDLEKIEVPTLIIGGDKDKIIPNYLQRILKKYIRNSSLYIVKDGSHVPQVDFPKSINERVRANVSKTLRLL